jgi:hypothetical protein
LIRLLYSNDVCSKTSVVVNVVVQCKNKIRLLSSNDFSSKASFVGNDVVLRYNVYTEQQHLLQQMSYY